VTREEPSFGGPAAAIAAGLDELALRGSRAGRVLVLACDLAQASEAAAMVLAASDRRPDGAGVVLTDPSARRQWLCGIYGAEALRASVDRLRAAGALASAPARSLFDGMRLHEVADPGGLSDDIDTPADLAAARERIRS
jgi:molybdopterin-guanine dinucleotide biosynthesis protein A